MPRRICASAEVEDTDKHASATERLTWLARRPTDLLMLPENNANRPSGDRRIPLWIKCAYTAIPTVVVIVYWRELGPRNFLWFSDIALIALVPALWLENRLLASMMAVGTLVLEVLWMIDFIALGNLTKIAAYMFYEGDDPPFHIRLLSGSFHFALPLTMLFALARLGYDRRALKAQSLLALIALPATYLLTDPSENINWVYGPVEPQELLPPLVYLALLILFFIVVIYIPSHWVLKRFFTPTGRRRKGS